MHHQLSPSEMLAFATVRIECDTAEGPSSGTGFFHQFCKQDNTCIPGIVTNRHVVKGATTGRFHIHLANSGGALLPHHHTRFEIPNFESGWIGHPDQNVDLCVALIGPLLHESQKIGKELFFKAFDHQLVPTQTEWQDLMAIEEIVMVGYPSGIWDDVNNMPIFRRGITATHPNLNYAGKCEFMIDAACFPGSSGSPVLLYNFGNFTDRRGNLVIGTRIKLLGVLYAGPQHTAAGEVVIMNVPTAPRTLAITDIPNNLGLVIKADRLREFDAAIQAVGGSAVSA
jgi:hypothetical protein